MESCEVLLDGFTRVREVVLEVLDGLSARRAGIQAGFRGQLDRLAGLAPDEGAGRPRLRRCRP